MIFGGSKDASFNKEVSDLLGTVRVSRVSYQTGRATGRTFSVEDVPVLGPEEVRELREKTALVVAENGKPVIAALTRCLDGRRGKALKRQQTRPQALGCDPPSATPICAVRSGNDWTRSSNGSTRNPSGRAAASSWIVGHGIRTWSTRSAASPINVGVQEFP